MKRTSNKTTKNKNNNSNNNNNLTNKNTEDVKEVNLNALQKLVQAQGRGNNISLELSSSRLPIKQDSPVYNPSPSPPPTMRTFGTLPSFLLGTTTSAPAPAPSTTTTTTSAPAPPTTTTTTTTLASSNEIPSPIPFINTPKEGGKRKKSYRKHKTRKHKSRKAKKSRRHTKRK